MYVCIFLSLGFRTHQQKSKTDLLYIRPGIRGRSREYLSVNFHNKDQNMFKFIKLNKSTTWLVKLQKKLVTTVGLGMNINK